MSDILNKWIGTAEVNARTIDPTDSSYVVAGLQDTGSLTVGGQAVFSSDATFSKLISSQFDSTSSIEFVKAVQMDVDSTAVGKFLVQKTLTVSQDATVGTRLRSLDTIIADQRIGIGTTNPSDRMVIISSDATTRVMVASSISSGTVSFNLGTTPDVRLAHHELPGTHYSELMNSDNVPFIIGTGGIERIRFTENTGGPNYGYIGIGTTVATSMIDVYGTSPIDNISGQIEIHGSETTGAINTGAGITFKGHDGGTPASSHERSWGAIQFLKENSSSGNTGSYARIMVRNNPNGVIEAIRIRDGTLATDKPGYVGIGTTDPTYPLTVQPSLANTDSISWRNGTTEVGRLGIDGATTNGWLSLYSGGVQKVQISSGTSYTYFNGGNEIGRAHV